MKTDFNKIIKPNMTFNFSLFKEGMRQLKIGGIAYAVLCALIASLALVCQLPYRNSYYSYQTVFDDLWNVNITTQLSMAFLMAIFIAASCTFIYSFLRNAKARDYYGALPHSLGSVWLSFTAAVTAWTFIGWGSCMLIQLPFILAIDTAFFFNWISCMLSIAAMAVFGIGIMSLASALTGKTLTYIITAAGLLALPDLLSLIGMLIKENIYNYKFYNCNTDAVPGGPLSYVFWLLDWQNAEYQSKLNSAGVTSAFFMIGVVYFAVAVFFTNMRTGDAAGKPFGSRAAHIFAHTVVNSCFAAIFMYLIIDIIPRFRYYSRVERYELLFIFAVAVALLILAHWISDLVLTFNLKQSLKSFKTLPLPICVALIFACVSGVSLNFDFHQTPKATDISSITLAKNYSLPDDLVIYRLAGTYGRAITEGYGIKNDKLNECVAEKLAEIVKKCDDKKYTDDSIETYVLLKINLKNGKTLLRRIPADDELYTLLRNSLQDNDDYMKQFTTLPDIDTVNIRFDNADGVTPEDMINIYNTFLGEFDTLSQEEKLLMIKNSGTECYDGYDAYYPDEEDPTIHEDMPTDEPTEPNYFFADTQCARGDFHVMTSDYLCAGAAQQSPLSISIYGYTKGHKYDSDYSFSQDFSSLSPKKFPKTYAAIVAATHKNADLLKEYKNDPDYMYIWVYYYGKNDGVEMIYEYFCEDFEKSFYGFYPDHSDVDYNYSYDENTGEEIRSGVKKRIPVNGRECIDRLIKDSASSETIDFSKPYCKATLDINGKRCSFFIQTGSLTDIYADEIAALAAEQSPSVN